MCTGIENISRADNLNRGIVDVIDKLDKLEQQFLVIAIAIQYLTILNLLVFY